MFHYMRHWYCFVISYDTFCPKCRLGESLSPCSLGALLRRSWNSWFKVNLYFKRQSHLLFQIVAWKNYSLGRFKWLFIAFNQILSNENLQHDRIRRGFNEGIKANEWNEEKKSLYAWLLSEIEVSRIRCYIC